MQSFIKYAIKIRSKMRNLKELFCVACIALFFTSCEETYNDKLFWPGEISQEYGSYIKPYTLDLTYSGEKLIGKTVSFKTENSETGDRKSVV